jgi:hypothetical protein
MVVPKKDSPPHHASNQEKKPEIVHAYQPISPVFKELAYEHFSEDELKIIDSSGELRRLSDGRLSNESLVKMFKTPACLEGMLVKIKREIARVEREQEQSLKDLEEKKAQIFKIDVPDFFPTALKKIFKELAEKEEQFVRGDVSVASEYYDLIDQAQNSLTNLGGSIERNIQKPENYKLVPSEFQDKLFALAKQVRKREAVWKKQIKKDRFSQLKDLATIRESLLEKKIYLMKCIHERDVLLSKNPDFFFSSDDSEQLDISTFS